MYKLITIPIATLLTWLMSLCAFSQSSPPYYDKIYTADGYIGLQEILSDNDPDSDYLGDRVAGYFLGRYALHSLTWYHLAWSRSPEYQSAVRRQNVWDRLVVET